ncbi:hypothetical protein EV426DRAFT_64182 [Tirmania nivea]|nr:hypothetical protein EV426DRAFT_64182 [Tirmania nivea]
MARTFIDEINNTSHNIFRIVQILTLIPIWALLAVVIGHYNRNNARIPGPIQFLFIVAILASVWSFCVLVTFLRARNTALWMTFLDLVTMALLIAAVVVLSNIANVYCDAEGVSQIIIPQDISSKYYPSGDERWWSTEGIYTYRQHCGQIKAAWGLAIANIIFFLMTAILTALIYLQNRQRPVVREKVVVEQPSPLPVNSPPPIAPPSPVHQEPYYDSPRRHSSNHQSRRSHSHRSHSHRSSRRSHHRGSHYEGRRNSSQDADYYA